MKIIGYSCKNSKIESIFCLYFGSKNSYINNHMASLPIKERIKQYRRLPQYFKVVQGLKGYNIVLFSQQFLQLGKGSFGKCYLGKIIKNQGQNLDHDNFDQLVRNDEIIAVKVIPKGKKTTPQQYKAQVKTLHTLSKDPKIINLVKIIFGEGIESDKNYYIVTEYCNNCTLFDLIETRKQSKQAKRKFTIRQFIQLALDLIIGYRAMKTNHIMHNDLKPQNIFIKDKVFKIGDFGLAVKLSAQDKEIPCGTIAYAAPEKLNPQAQKKDIDHKADIYSIGLILYEVLYGRHPYLIKEEYEKFKHEQHKKMTKQKTLQKYNEKQLRKLIFYKYLQKKQLKNMQLQLEPFGAQLVDLMKNLQNLVKGMCVKQKNQRKSLQQIVKDMKQLNLQNYVVRKGLFTDLAQLSQSQFKFQLANMSRYGVSTVQTNSIKNTIKMLGTQPIVLKRVITMKQSLFVTFQSFKILQILREVAEGYLLQAESPRKALFSQVMANYLYCINLRELSLTIEQLQSMSEEELRVAKRQNVEADLGKLKQNDLELYNKVKLMIDFEEEDSVRIELKEFIKDQLLNQIVTLENWNEILAWVLLYDVILIEHTYRNAENKEEMGIQLRRVQQRLKLFKSEELSEKDYEMGLEVLKENQKYFPYSYEILQI